MAVRKGMAKNDKNNTKNANEGIRYGPRTGGDYRRSHDAFTGYNDCFYRDRFSDGNISGQRSRGTVGFHCLSAGSCCGDTCCGMGRRTFWRTALLLLPQGAGALLTRTAAGRLTDAYGGRVVATGGFLACVISTAPFLFLGDQTGSILLYVFLFIRGLAIGMLIVPITTSAFRGLPDADVSRATVIIRAFQQVGGSFGTAAVAAAVATGQTVSLAATESADDFIMSFLVLVAVSAAGAVASLIFPRSK